VTDTAASLLVDKLIELWVERDFRMADTPVSLVIDLFDCLDELNRSVD
jgi:hypothetical protein